MAEVSNDQGLHLAVPTSGMILVMMSAWGSLFVESLIWGVAKGLRFRTLGEKFGDTGSGLVGIQV